MPVDRIVQTQDFPTLDPIFVSGVGGQELAALLYSYLVKMDDRAPRARCGRGGPAREWRYQRRRKDDHLPASPRRPLLGRLAVTSFDVAETIGRIAFPGSDVPTRVAFDDVAAVVDTRFPHGQGLLA